MKISLRPLLPCLIAVSTLALTAYSGGMAAVAERGYTGAPTPGGGTELTCSTCHNSGDYGEPQLAVRLNDQADSTYRPGTTYRVTVAVRPGAGQPAGYGFQAQFLTDATEPATAGTLSAPGTGAQITPLDNGRVYAEHQKVNTDSLFTFDWTAPEAGTGMVKMYLVGNTVNFNGSTTGDNGSSAPLVVTFREETSTGIRPGLPQDLTLGVFPNPAPGGTRIRLNSPRPETATVSLYSAAGTVVSTSARQLTAGNNEWWLGLQGLPAGAYYLRVQGGSRMYSARILHR